MASKRIFRACKLQGLSLHADALARLTAELTNEPSLALDDVLYAIKNSIDKSKMTTSVVTLEALESALDTLLAVSSENQFEAIQMFNAFETPKLHFSSHTNSYELKADSHRRIHAGPEDRLNLLRDRFISVDLRVKRNKMFSPPAVSVSNTVEYIEVLTERERATRWLVYVHVRLSRIESLLGVTGVKRVIGMLGQDERKRIYLEDLTSRIYVDLTNATYTNGLFTINCIVLVEGEVIDDVLHVHSMGFPPPEPKAQSLSILSGIDPLGVEVSAQQLEQIRELEAGDHHATFIVLSDVHLDDPQVMKHLDILFQGLESVLPSLFVLMGDFISSSIGGGAGSNSLQDLKEYFDELANLILKYPRLAEFSKFVLVPGPNDPGSSRAFPRHPLPSMCTQELMRRVPNVTCTTNPCRIRYYTQDLVIFRDNLHQKMQRHALLPVISDEGDNGDEAEPIDVDNEDGDAGERGGQSSQVDISKHLVKTIIDQAHLTPLPLMACPINWAFDSSLQLFPLPDVLILGDATEQFQLGYSSVAVFHPGPFHVDFSFVLYRPSTNTTEFSRVEKLAQRSPEGKQEAMGDASAGTTRNFVSQWRTQQEPRECAHKVEDPGIQWRSVQRVANKQKQQLQQNFGYHDNYDIGSIYANEAAPQWLGRTCTTDRRKGANAVSVAIDEFEDHDEPESPSNGYSSDPRTGTKSFKPRARPQSASVSRPQASRDAVIAGQFKFVAAKSRVRPQSAKLQRSHDTAQHRDKPMLSSSIMPEQIKDSKWTEMMFRSPDFQQQNLIRLEQDTYELLQSVFRKERAVQVSKLSQHGGNTGTALVCMDKKKSKKQGPRQRSVQNSVVHKFTKSSEAKKKQVSCTPSGVPCGSGMQLARDRQQYPVTEYHSSSRYGKLQRSTSSQQNQQSQALSPQNQLENGDNTILKTQTPRQLARVKPATKMTTTKGSHSATTKERKSGNSKISDREDDDDAVRNRVLQELGWAHEEEDPVRKVKAKKKKTTPPHGAKPRNTTTHAQPARCSIPEVEESRQGMKPASASSESGRPLRAHVSPRSATKESSRCTGLATAVQTSEHKSRSGNELGITPDMTNEEVDDPVLLQLILRECRRTPSHEEPGVDCDEEHRNSTLGDEFHRQQILRDLDSLPTVSKLSLSRGLDEGPFSTPVDIGTRDGLHASPPDLPNETLEVHVDADTRNAVEGLDSPQQPQEKETEVDGSTTTASDSEVTRDSSLEIQVDEDSRKVFGHLQSASEEHSRVLKNESVLPDTACSSQSEQLPQPVQEGNNRAADAEEDPTAACEYEQEERTPSPDNSYDPDPAEVELSDFPDSVMPIPDLNSPPGDYQRVLLDSDEHERSGELELELLGEQEDEEMVGGYSNFVFTEMGSSGDELLQDHDDVVCDDSPLVFDESVDNMADSNTVGSATTVTADPVCCDGDETEKSNIAEETLEGDEEDQQQQQPDCDCDDHVSAVFTVRSNVGDQGPVSRDLMLLEGDEKSQDAVLGHELPQHGDQPEIFTAKWFEYFPDPNSMERADAADNFNSLNNSSNGLLDAAEHEHVAQVTQPPSHIDGVYELDELESVLREEEYDSEAVETAIASVRSLDSPQTIGDGSDLQARQPPEIVEKTELHGDTERTGASPAAESPVEFLSIRQDTTANSRETGVAKPEDTGSKIIVEMVAASTADSINYDRHKTGASENTLCALARPPSLEIESESGINKSAAASDALLACDDIVESDLLQAIDAGTVGLVRGYTTSPLDTEATVPPDPHPVSCHSGGDDTSTIVRDFNENQDFQHRTGDDSSEQHSPSADAVAATECVTSSEINDSNQNVQKAHASENGDSSFGSHVVVELSAFSLDELKTSEVEKQQSNSEPPTAEGESLSQSEHEPPRTCEISEALGSDRSSAVDKNASLGEVQATDTEAARKIQRQYRCFVQRQILADQLKFLVSQHHRQVRKKARRASKKASAVAALLAPVGNPSVDPPSLEADLPAAAATASSLESENSGATGDTTTIGVCADATQEASEKQDNVCTGEKLSCEPVPTPEFASSTDDPHAEEPPNAAGYDVLTDNLVEQAKETLLRVDDANAATFESSFSAVAKDELGQDAQEHQVGGNVGDDPVTLETPHVQEEIGPVHVSSEPTWTEEHQHRKAEEQLKDTDPEPFATAVVATGDAIGDTQEPPDSAMELTSQETLQAVALDDNSAEVETSTEADNSPMLNPTLDPTTPTAITQADDDHVRNAKQDAYLRSRAASIALAALAFADDDNETDFVSSEALANESEELTDEPACPSASAATSFQSDVKELPSEEDSAVHKWERYLDAATNKSYYYNPSTQVSQWTLPQDATQVVDRTTANGFNADTNAWSGQVELTNTSIEAVDQARQQQEAWQQVREQSLLLESAGGWDKYLMPESTTIFFYHQGRDEYFHCEDSSAPVEFSEAKAQLLHELHQSPAEQSQVEATDDHVMINAGEGYEAAPVEASTVVEQWGLRRNLSLSAENRGEWQAFVDAESHQIFYYNAHTSESTWETPAVFQDTVTEDTAITGGQRATDYQWTMYIDEGSGAPYYVNLATDETSWEKPDDFDEWTTVMTVELLMRQEIHEAVDVDGELQKQTRQRNHDNHQVCGSHDGEGRVDEEEDDYVIRIDEHSAEQLDELF